MNRTNIGTIRQWMDESIYHHVSKETDVQALWKKFESLFEKKTTAKKAFFIKELVNMKYVEDVSVTEHLNKRQNYSETRFNGGCHYCGKKSHMKKHCRKWKKEQKDGNNTASVVTYDEELL
ncbi:hypothetical protein DVH24_000044 [Malus domestica]|uniref:CCHC-type domain-containing protein n=1 Tax=Malus domestica TaxID=3750 RepID=A0A498J1B5_MALDO|nr:hypothetical protein DVH24_000044 [Malus domestica]